MSAVVERMPQEIQAPAVTTPMEMLASALERGMSIEVITKLMDLQERWQATEARKAFDRALAEAKAEIPIIRKNREVDFTSSKGRTHYQYEDLAGVIGVVDPILARHGLYIRFDTKSEPNEPVKVTCIIGHKDGHFITNTLSAGRDDSGNKNHIQQIGSTATYLQRMTLKAALGLAAAADDDGALADDGGTELITADQVRDLQQRVMDANANLQLFYKHFGIENLPDLPAKRYAEAVRMLDQKKRKAAQA